MKVTLDQSTIRRIIQMRHFTGSKQSHLDVLNYVLISADGHVSLQATNLSVRARVILPGEVSQNGTILVPIEKLEALKDEESIRITAGEKEIRIYYNGDKSYMRILRKFEFADFPQAATPSESERTLLGKLSAAKLKTAVRHIQGIPDDDDTGRTWATSIWIQVANDILTAGAADGFQLALRHIELDGETREFTGLANLQIARLVSFLEDLGDDESVIELSASESAFLLQTPTASAFVMRVEGGLPNYKAIIPDKNGAVKVTVQVGEMRNAIQAVRAFATNNNLCTLSVSSNQVMVSAAGEAGSARVKLNAEVENAPSEILSVNLDIQRLREVLVGPPNAARLVLHMHAWDRPVLFEFEPGKSSGRGILPGLDVIMPMATD